MSVKMMDYKLLSLILVIINYVGCANILYVIPFSSPSHYIFFRPIGLELARRGHNVTVITSLKEEHPPSNYRQIMVDDKKIWDIIGGKRPKVFSMVDISAEEFHHKILWTGGLAFTEHTLNSTEVKRFLKEDNTFDLVIVEQFFFEALYTLAHKYKAPLVLITSFGTCMRHNFVNGNPLQLATVLAEFLDVKDIHSFWGRLRNLNFMAYEYLWWRFVYLKQQEQLVKEYLPDLADTAPSLYSMQGNVSLMMINSHFSFDTPAALLPNIVEIGGVHLSRNNTSLPKDLQNLLDKSVNGVVYMSFGSNVRSSEMSVEMRNAFINVFKKLKQTVLWKWEDDQLEGKPSNLEIRKWLPQKDILAHPNVKVFISHGGLIGMQEAIFNGVPLIGVPIYADQYNNLLLAQEAGFGKILQYHEINEVTLEKTLLEVLYNESYILKARERSQLFKDRPMNALDTAMFWIEYVIRNKGADYMKNPARNLSWISYNMIDVYIFIISIIIGISLVVINILKIIFRLVFGRNYVTSDKKRL